MLNGELDNNIKSTGKVTSKVHLSYLLDEECYNFRLTTPTIDNKNYDFTVKCFEQTLVKNINYGDTVTVEGYFIDKLYCSKDGKSLKNLRVIYSNSIKKL